MSSVASSASAKAAARASRTLGDIMKLTELHIGTNILPPVTSPLIKIHKQEGVESSR